MATGKNLSRHRKRLCLTLDQLSDISGVERGTIGALEVRDSKRSDFFGKLAKALGMTVEQLEDESYLSDNLLPSSNTKLQVVSAESEPSNLEQAPALRGKVPLISFVKAGEFAEVIDNLQPGDGEEWIDATCPVNRYTFALRVVGDSMEPDFPAGMILIIEPELSPEQNDYVIAKNGDGEATFKQLTRDGADWYLKPLNPRYPIKPLGTSRIIGVVRDAVRKFR